MSRALTTATVTRGDIFRCSVYDSETQRSLQLVGVGSDLSAPGVLLIQSEPAGPWSELNLSPLEFALLRLLFVHAQNAASANDRMEAHIPTGVLARRLPFRSPSADEDNVRQAVRRVRRTLASIDIENLIVATPGRGYRISWSVEA